MCINIKANKRIQYNTDTHFHTDCGQNIIKKNSRFVTKRRNHCVSSPTTTSIFQCNRYTTYAFK